jgi:hypothetical protein
MQHVPEPYYRHKQLTFTEAVLAQLRTWPWAEMVDPDSAHGASSTPFEFHSNTEQPSPTHTPHEESVDPEDSW